MAFLAFAVVNYIKILRINNVDEKMHKKSVLLVAMPFAGPMIPSAQLPILEGYAKERDIDIQTRHLYLKAAELYGINSYNFLINPPNNSYMAQMAFTKYVFPEHWKQTEEQCKKYFNERILWHLDKYNASAFENYIQQTDRFYHWVLDNVDWKSYDIIGFTLNYGQLIPSLAIAKKIKELYPEKKIILGGSQTSDKLGVNVLQAFDYIDFIVSGDGEDALSRLASDYQNYEYIPRLMYRLEDEVIWNQSETYVDLNASPMPNFDPFYEELNKVSKEVQQFFQANGRLPIEISRGCWWNNCTFCNLNIQYPCYREKNVKRIVEEIEFLSDKYAMRKFQIIGNTLPKKDYRLLFEEIIKLGRDFDFFVEARAGQLKSDDYRLMKEAGFNNIQIGIESFSQNYLKKMNKGVRVIDNIAALKFCKENGIRCQYNLVVNYPNEETIDFEETKKNIQHFKQYLDPPQISYFVVEFGSIIYNNPAAFNIEKLEYTNVDKIMFPSEVLKKGISFYYNFKRKNDLGENDWEKLVNEWRQEQQEQRQYALDETK